MPRPRISKQRPPDHVAPDGDVDATTVVRNFDSLHRRLNELEDRTDLSGSIDSSFKSYTVLRNQVTGTLDLSGPMATERLRFSGQEFLAANHSDNSGPCWLLGVNRAGNRQLWLAESPAVQSGVSGALAFFVNTTEATINSITTDGNAAKPLRINPNGGLVTVGGNLRMLSGSGFNGATPVGVQAVTGSRSTQTAQVEKGILQVLVNLGLVVDNTTA